MTRQLRRSPDKGNEHLYPSNYPPGTHWATDQAWAILDHVKPGAIPDDVRMILAGMIAGTLLKYSSQR